jgi:formylglycine-generating enzyme required for sulfatase activity
VKRVRVVGLGALGLCACGLVFDLDVLGPGPIDASDAGAEEASSLEAATVCGSDAGSKMIDADGQCIDATEVTVDAYATFVASAKVLPFATPCAWVRSLAPSDFDAQREHGDYPVVNVNFCHALGYCAWAGKRLCGRTTGGAVLPGDAGKDPHAAQWLRACTHDGAQSYPYGTVLSSACPNKTGPVTSPTACGGPYAGLFGMIGNVAEWVDGCASEGASGEHDECTAFGYEVRVRGEVTCYDSLDLSRNAVAPDLGFRCCGP